MKRVVAIICLCLWVTSAQASEVASGQQVLRSMLQSISDTSFAGSFLYARGKDIQLMKLVHRQQNGVEQARIWHINGENLQIVRVGNEVVCYHPSASRIALSHNIPAGPFAQIMQGQFEQGLKNYSVQVLGQDRVAEHQAQVIMLMPLDKQRYSVKLWIEQDSKLLLRSELVGLNNDVLEQFQFVTLNLQPNLTDADFEVPVELMSISHRETRRMPVSDNAAMLADDVAWQPVWMPDGYQLKQVDVSGNRLLYSDGLSSFSLFRAMNDESMPAGAQRYGATVAIVKRIGENTVTLVGEIPVSTGERILASIKLP